MTRKQLISATFIGAMILIVAAGAYGWLAPDTLTGPKLEILKALFSFGFVTLIGGLLTIYLNLLKDEEDKKRADAKEEEEKKRADAEKAEELKRAADKETAAHAEEMVQLRADTLRQFDAIYRDFKFAKRTLRSRVERNDASGVWINKEFFEKTMDSVCRTQLSLEQMRQVGLKDGVLFKDDQAERLLRGTRYIARYLHDVFEDFERNKVKIENGFYVIPPTCFNLNDFLDRGKLADEVKQLEDIMYHDTNKLSARWDAFMKIRELRSGEPRGVEGKRLRCRAVAETCATLIALEMRTTEAVDAVPESDPVISAQSPSGAAHAQSGEQDRVPLSITDIADSTLAIAGR